MKTIDTDTLNQFISSLVRPVIMVKLEFDDQTIGVNSTLSTITFDGTDYLGLGQYGGISNVAEDSELSAAGVQVGLSGVEQANVSVALQEPTQGRPTTIYLAGLEEDLKTLVGDPMVIFKGRMDIPIITLGGTASIQMKVENLLADWDRPNTKRYNNETQQSLYEGDKFFEFGEQSVEKEIFWGKASA